MKLTGNRTPKIGMYYKFKYSGEETIIAEVSRVGDEYIFIKDGSIAISRFESESNWIMWELTELEKALV